MGIITKSQALRILQVVIINQTMVRAVVLQTAAVVANYFKTSMEIVGSGFEKKLVMEIVASETHYVRLFFFVFKKKKNYKIL